MSGLATMRAMIELGLTDEQKLALLAAMEEDAAPKDPTAAARQQRRRDKVKAERDESRVTSRRDASPNDIVSNPQQVTSGAKAPSVTATPRKADLFVCPEGVEPAHWRDFMANRKRKRCATTETAYQGILSDLAKHADPEWPPGRLVKHAAAKGWASINDPRTSLGPLQNGRSGQAPDLRGSRPSPALELYKRGKIREAEEADFGEDRAPDWGAGAALPAIGAGGP